VVTQKFLTAVKTLLHTFVALEEASDGRIKLEQQLAYLTEAESADASHPIHTLVSRFVQNESFITAMLKWRHSLVIIAMCTLMRLLYIEHNLPMLPT